MDILLASGNQHKLNELAPLLAPHKLHLPFEFGIDFDCEETGSTFEENALMKAKKLLQDSQGLTDMSVLADDSGLLVDALPGELGVHTARFGSPDGVTILPAEAKNLMLIDRMRGLKGDQRKAEFVCVLVLMDRKGKTITVKGVSEGRILEEPDGIGGFGYDPVFYNNEAGCSNAALGKDKGKFSHRGKAVRLLMEKLNEKAIPTRDQIAESDKWDLADLYATEADYEKDLEILKKNVKKADSFKGTLGMSPQALLDCLKYSNDNTMLLEKLYNYASLNNSAEAQNPKNQKRLGKLMHLYSEFVSSISWMDPEILAIEDLEKWIEDKAFDDYRIPLKKLLRQRPHTLSEKEEAILAKEDELQDTCRTTFSVLTNIDMDFGKIDGKDLSQSTYGSFLQNRDRSVRERAYKQFYETYRKHEQTIAALYSGSVKQDIFNARIRGFETALDASLYRDNVPKSVYTGLIEAVHSGFDSLHRFYSLKKKVLKLDELRHYDVYVPIVDTPVRNTPYEEAAKIVKEALAPLGKDYVDTIYKGITTDRWVDRYENKGKRSGAFSSGGFIGKPYILLNYKEDVLNSIFTLAHEGGHSMHSYYSKNNNPFPYYDYTIFEAEVASTFNEQLLAKYFIDNAEDEKTKAYIVAKQLDDIVGTLFRQTMFAEYELICHTQQENGEPLTLDSLRKNYRSLLEQYFGPEMVFEDVSDLEGLRIPHFYNAYYVYKYSTGISASIALSERVLNGGKKELDDYLGFLKSGGSKFPIDSLKGAGVDMSTQEPVKAAVAKFTKLLGQLESLIL